MVTKYTILQTIFLLSLSFTSYCKERDSIYIDPNWSSLSIKELNMNGKWAIITQSTQNNQDTIFIVNSLTKEKIIKTKAHSLNFINSDHLIYLQEDTLEIFDLNTYQTTKIDQVSKYELLKTPYILITKKDGSRQVVDTFGKVYWSFTTKEKFYFNQSKTKIFYYSQDENTYLSLLNLNNFKTTEIIKLTDPPILSFSLNKNEDIALVTYINSGKIKLESININNKKRVVIPIPLDEKEQINGIQTVFLDKNNLYIQCYIEKSSILTQESIVDVWNSFDKNIEGKMEPNQEYSKAYIYNLKSEEIKSILTSTFNESIYINHSYRFLIFDRFENVDYTSFIPSINLYLYDMVKNKKTLIQDSLKTVNSNLTYSYDGNYIAIKPNNQWVFINTSNLKKDICNNIRQQQQLYWIENSNSAYIVGDGDIWLYNYETGATKNLSNFNNKDLTISILNTKTYANNLSQGFGLFPKFIKKEAPLVFTVINKKNNYTGLYGLEKNILKTFLAPTSNYISNIVWDKNLTNIYYRSENFNSPGNINVSHSNNSELVVKNSTPKSLYNWRKQKIIDFEDKYGNVLKGILYYPKEFKINEKYPMITHIYEDQFYLANKFEIPTIFNYKGFSVPLFTELGYFVFLPDTNISIEGPARAALDCVTSAIEKAVKIEPSINKDKLGLIGQSFGGYKTNFIITQTKLFKAAVSGAAVSDIINNYYSYNYNYNKPSYWKFENGQYNIKKPPASDLELYLNNNPILFVNRINTPLLTWAGLDDYNVHWEHTRLLFTALKRYNKTHVALFYKNQGHSLSNPLAQKDLTYRTIQWFNLYLYNK